MSTLTEIFGEPISVYTREQAIEDGFLVDVSEHARTLGYMVPVAMSRAAWTNYAEWTDADTKRQTYQDQAGRLHDVLWMARGAAKAAHQTACENGNSGRAAFSFYSVPRGGRARAPRLRQLHIVRDGDGFTILCRRRIDEPTNGTCGIGAIRLSFTSAAQSRAATTEERR